jgi:hypothetical protein
LLFYCISGIFVAAGIAAWSQRRSHELEESGAKDMQLMTRMTVALAVTVVAALALYFIFLHGAGQ